MQPYEDSENPILLGRHHLGTLVEANFGIHFEGLLLGVDLASVVVPGIAGQRALVGAEGPRRDGKSGDGIAAEVDDRDLVVVPALGVSGFPVRLDAEGVFDARGRLRHPLSYEGAVLRAEGRQLHFELLPVRLGDGDEFLRRTGVRDEFRLDHPPVGVFELPQLAARGRRDETEICDCPENPCWGSHRDSYPRRRNAARGVGEGGRACLLKPARGRGSNWQVRPITRLER